MLNNCGGNCITCGRCIQGPILDRVGKSRRRFMPQKGYGFAIDIGTTTVVLALIDFEKSEARARHSFMNPQRAFGPDVISRIDAANKGHLNELQSLIFDSLCLGMETLLRAKDISKTDIAYAVIAGNTVMTHLLLGFPCESLGVLPFRPTSVLAKSYDGLFTPAGINCGVHVMPWLAAYVGGDITAGLLHVIPEGSKRFLLLDIGTNGEIALYDSGSLLVTATAAGPAFEIPINDSKTVRGASGIISALAELVRQEDVDETGLLTNEDVFDQKQVRDLQLAKSAIRSGLEILLEEGGLTYSDLDAVYLAGGIGQAMNIEDAACIGLIPHEIKSLSRAVGNASLGGAIAYLTDMAAASEEVKQFQSMANEINLASHKNFNSYYMENMFFGG